MKVNEYKVLTEAIERGISYGWNRAYKHTDNPTPDAVKTQIEDAVLQEVCEYFDFSGVEEDIY